MVFLQESHIFSAIAEDIKSDTLKKKDNITIAAMNFPGWILRFLVNTFAWVFIARENGLSKKDIYRKPYQ
ncbi:MAG: hypothetical protein JXB88_11095 [Spirochaetales bacterium]|nr:hypothetical protein [Spirochaetales bacterium]